MLILILKADNGYIVTVHNNYDQTVYVAGDMQQAVEIVDGILKSTTVTPPPRELQ